MEEKILYRTQITLTINGMVESFVSDINYGIPSESEYKFKDYQDLLEKHPCYSPLYHLDFQKSPFRRKFIEFIRFRDAKITEKILRVQVSR